MLAIESHYHPATSLKQSATLCRNDEILTLIQQISPTQVGLARGLEQLVGDFQFDKISTLIKGATSEIPEI